MLQLKLCLSSTTKKYNVVIHHVFSFIVRFKGLLYILKSDWKSKTENC